MDVLAGRYELGATLGAGGMARVVEAHDRLLDRAVAVKLLRDDVAIDPAIRERFLREARTAARFTHPNAVAVYDTGQDGRQPWIVMELVRGEDLSRRLSRTGALRPDDAVRIADAVLAALGAAHRDGMVHRDVKPGNIMLLDDGGVKLADFGIAKSVQDATAGMTATGQVIGTAKYLAPEQVEGRPATPASDVYAAGVVLYEMVAGQPPYDGDNAIAIALAHTRQPGPDVRRVAPHVPEALAAAISRAMAKDPADRFADAEQMREALAGRATPAAPTQVLAAPAPTRVLPTASAPRRGGGGIFAVLAIGAVLVVAGLVAANRDDEPSDGRTPRAQRGERTEQEEDRPADEATDEPQAEPTEPEATEAEPEPTEAPQTEAPPPPTEEGPDTPVPTDIDGLISFLEANPDQFGPRQTDLLNGLGDVAKHGGEKQARNAADLQPRVVEWAEAGELEPAVADAALALLEPIAATAKDEPGNDDEDD